MGIKPEKDICLACVSQIRRKSGLDQHEIVDICIKNWQSNSRVPSRTTGDEMGAFPTEIVPFR